MNQKHPAESLQQGQAEIAAAARPGRRKLIQAGLASAPVLLALKSTPVLAGNCKHPSGFSVSGNLSATGGKNCATRFPSINEWVKADPGLWPSGYPRDTALFGAALTAGAIGHDADIGTFRLIDALNDASNPLNAKAAAVFLGSFNSGPPSFSVVQALWADGVRGGGYATLGYKSESAVWHQTEVEKYFDYLLGLNP
ncbi:MAG: hypothetical protein L6Q65_08825 [Zoogloea sp.]|nr:hypothetical protein [Zoogloea sp.]